MARVWFAAATSSLDALGALLDEPAQKPLRKLAIVGPREEEETLPAWMTKRHGGGPDGAA